MAVISEDAIERLKNLALKRCMERLERAKAMPKPAPAPAPHPPGVTRLLKSRHGLL
ncbi:MAG: hypothetical protein QXL43_00170 [Methanolinea sp.]|nr:hypothetical protein [Methanolinea sp.]